MPIVRALKMTAHTGSIFGTASSSISQPVSVKKATKTSGEVSSQRWWKASR